VGNFCFLTCWNRTPVYSKYKSWSGSGGLNHMVVGFKSTYAISVYHHLSCKFESWSWRGDFLWFPPPIKTTDPHNIPAILLKVVLNTINLTKMYFVIYVQRNLFKPSLYRTSFCIWNRQVFGFNKLKNKNTTFNNIAGILWGSVVFIGGGNQRKPPRHDQDSNLQLKWW
jgi:hypothetical protein